MNRQHSTRSWISRGQALTTILVSLLVIGVGWIIIDRQSAELDKETAVEDLQLAEDNAAVIAGQVREQCDLDGAIARELGDLCRQAEQVEQNPTETIPGRPPTAEEIESAVATVLAERPGLVRAELVAAVASHLTRNPPEPGEDAPPPSDAQVFAAVIDYCSDGRCQGDDGADAEPLTQGEIDAAFTRFCSSGACQGEDGSRGLSCVEELGLEACRGDDGDDGTDGVDGRGIVSVAFVNGGDCRMVITYDRPDADGSTVQEIPGMPANMCKAPETPPGS